MCFVNQRLKVLTDKSGHTRVLRIGSRTARRVAENTGSGVQALERFPELVPGDPIGFKSARGQPWTVVCLAMADQSGSYAVGDDLPPQINVVELICGDGADQWHRALATRIADWLGWEVLNLHGS